MQDALPQGGQGLPELSQPPEDQGQVLTRPKRRHHAARPRSAEAAKHRKAAIYVRVSTEDQAKHGFSLDAQRDYLVHEVQSQGLEFVREYRDAGRSGKDMEGRPEFQRMLHDARTTTDFDILFVYHTDRFARNAVDATNMVQELRDNGVDVWFGNLAGEAELSDPTRYLSFGVSLVIDEHQRKVVSRKTSFGITKLIGQGYRWGPRPGTFFEEAGKDDKGVRIRPRPELLEMQRLHDVEGLSHAEIAKRFGTTRRTVQNNLLALRRLSTEQSGR